MIKCQVCGGTTVLNDGILYCENCGNKQQIISYFDNTEVFLDCIETDIQERRTKDSVIAQDLYFKLESNNISTFFKRISVGDVVDYNQSEKCCNAALNNAKIILLVSTCNENFEQLIENTKKFFDNKIVIPIYSGSSASIIPEYIKKYQALNYESIGAVNDLISIILNFLGKRQELNTVNSMIKNTTKRRWRLSFSICTILFISIILVIYFIFATPYVLKSKKYIYANSLVEESKFATALEVYSELDDYKNSSNIKKNIYSKYEGYYNNDEGNLQLKLYINNYFVSDIEIMLLHGQSKIKITSSAKVDVNKINFSFSDNRNRQGNGIIELKDHELVLTIKYFSDNSDFEEICNTFDIFDKKDIPDKKDVTSYEIMKWMSEPKHQSDFYNMGYTLIFSDNTYRSNQKIFQIENNDVYIVVFNKVYIPLDDDFQKINKVEDGSVFAIKAPASILIPEYIGSKFEKFEKDNIFYCVDPIFYDLEQDGIACRSKGNDTIIEENTMIGAIPRNWISKNNWDKLIYFDNK